MKCPVHALRLFIYLLIYVLVIYLTTLAVNQATHLAMTVELLAGISFMLVSRYLRKIFYTNTNL